MGSARMIGANFDGANLDGADLRYSVPRRASFRGANLARVHLHETIFADTCLAGALGLETCIHDGPSTVDHRTLSRSPNISAVFLRACGLPEPLIQSFPALVAGCLPYYSCFLSYSGADREFADRLRADLQRRGLQCWFAPADLKPGESIKDTLDEAIRLGRKVILILSRNSLASEWVELEVTIALKEERHRGAGFLVPIRLDAAVLESSTEWARDLREARQIANFSEHANPEVYSRELMMLIAALTYMGRVDGEVVRYGPFAPSRDVSQG